MFLKLNPAVLLILIVTAQVRFTCKTPKGVDGVCVNIKQCKTLLTLLATQLNNVEVRTFLLQSLCIYNGKDMVVCCESQPQLQNLTSKTLIVTSSTVATTSPTTTPKSTKSLLLSPPYCGRSNSSDSRIVGGVRAQLGRYSIPFRNWFLWQGNDDYGSTRTPVDGQFPWIVALGYRNNVNPSQPKWLCGGSLITYTHVMTAGHCVYTRRDLYMVRVGDIDLFTDEDNAHPEDILLTNIKLHEAYSETFSNDIAILTLAHKPTIAGVWPICLPTTPLQSKDSPFVAGWGTIYFQGPSSGVLQVVQLPIVSNFNCKRSFSRFKQQVIDDRVLCAGDIEGKKSSCQGDSGGPLMLSEKIGEDQNAFYGIGIVSYSFMCANPDYPTVYTNTSRFLDWIISNLN